MHWPSTLPKPHAVLFDLDGVIIDSSAAHAAAWTALFAEQGLVFTAADYAHRASGRSRDQVIREVLGEREDHDALMHRKAELMDRVPHLPTVPGSLPFVDALRLPYAIATSSRIPELLLQKAGLAGRFPVIVGRADVERGKPDPAVFLEAARRLGMNPVDTVVVEDAPAGVEAGLAAGCTVVGLGDSALLHQAHVVVPSLPLAWLEVWNRP